MTCKEVQCRQLIRLGASYLLRREIRLAELVVITLVSTSIQAPGEAEEYLALGVVQARHVNVLEAVREGEPEALDQRGLHTMFVLCQGGRCLWFSARTRFTGVKPP